MDAYKLGYWTAQKDMIPSTPLEMKTSRCSIQTCPLRKVAKEAVAEEDGAEEDAADGVVADVIDQACGAAESVADQADTEEAVDQGSPAGVSEIAPLRKLASAKAPLNGLRACFAYPLGWLGRRLASPEGRCLWATEAWRPHFKKFLAHPASPLGRFFSGLRLQTDAFSRRPASPLGRSLWAIEAWRPHFKKFLAHPASPLGRFFSGMRLQTDAFSRHPASPLGRSLWATI
ncbi:unnamed protein product [Prunus armeniaca]